MLLGRAAPEICRMLKRTEIGGIWGIYGPIQFARASFDDGIERDPCIHRAS